MNFAEAWDLFDIDDAVAVSNETPMPAAAPDSLAMRIWGSHNFTGALAEKIDGDNRAMRFDLPPNEAGNIIGFTLRETDGHLFIAA